jgi:lipopolysaccharide export system permease protein
MADSGKMFTIMEESYLVMELFNGKSYSEMVGDANSSFKQYVRNDFTKSKFVFSLESFSMQRTQEGLFASNKIMRNMSELDKDVDSLKAQTDSLVKLTFNSIKPFYSYSFRNDTIKPKKINNKADFNKDSVLRINTIRYATNSARNVKSYLVSQKERIENSKRETNSFKIEFHKKITLSFACLVMFLIGAPLGAIIKKGGLGVPVIISIIFFIFYYIVSMLTEKWAKEGLIGVEFGMWAANLLYLPIGLFFLRQARNDSRLLETDYFAVQWEKLRNKIFKKN